MSQDHTETTSPADTATKILEEFLHNEDGSRAGQRLEIVIELGDSGQVSSGHVRESAA